MQLDVASKFPNGEVHLAFRYCPPGQGFRGRPEPLPKESDGPLAMLTRKKLVVTLKAFYITETEISQGVYKQILGQAALDQIKDRVAKLGGIPIGDEYPILARLWTKLLPSVGDCKKLRQATLRMLTIWKLVASVSRLTTNGSMPLGRARPSMRHLPHHILVDGVICKIFRRRKGRTPKTFGRKWGGRGVHGHSGAGCEDSTGSRPVAGR